MIGWDQPPPPSALHLVSSLLLTLTTQALRYQCTLRVLVIDVQHTPREYATRLPRGVSRRRRRRRRRLRVHRTDRDILHRLQGVACGGSTDWAAGRAPAANRVARTTTRAPRSEHTLRVHSRCARDRRCTQRGDTDANGVRLENYQADQGRVQAHEVSPQQGVPWSGQLQLWPVLQVTNLLKRQWAHLDCCTQQPTSSSILAKRASHASWRP
jgi:hypothetical protein